MSRTEFSRAAVALRPSFSVSVTRAGRSVGVLRAVIAGSAPIRTSGRSLAMTDQEKKFTAWHEAGHAIVNVLLKHTHPLHKVTIIPRGQSLGATMSLPKQDILSRRRKEMLDDVAMIMGGRIAEEIVSEDISTGAAMDIQQATTDLKRQPDGCGEKQQGWQPQGEDIHAEKLVTRGDDPQRHDPLVQPDVSLLPILPIEWEIRMFE